MLNIVIEDFTIINALTEGEYTAFRVKNQRSCLELLTLLATLKVKPGKEVEVTEICTQLAKEVLERKRIV
ncbi:MAG: hypothetical protein P4L49_03535 [Desulfosporosinus sp.]|nr:hypothetical protein [Desulfosporosinus sp.]